MGVQYLWADYNYRIQSTMIDSFGVESVDWHGELDGLHLQHDSLIAFTLVFENTQCGQKYIYNVDFVMMSWVVIKYVHKDENSIFVKCSRRQWYIKMRRLCAKAVIQTLNTVYWSCAISNYRLTVDTFLDNTATYWSWTI